MSLFLLLYQLCKQFNWGDICKKGISRVLDSFHSFLKDRLRHQKMLTLLINAPQSLQFPQSWISGWIIWSSIVWQVAIGSRCKELSEDYLEESFLGLSIPATNAWSAAAEAGDWENIPLESEISWFSEALSSWLYFMDSLLPSLLLFLLLFLEFEWAEDALTSFSSTFWPLF